MPENEKKNDRYKIKYISQNEAFLKIAASRRFNPRTIALYEALLSLNNRNFWSQWFYASNEYLMLKTHISNEGTLRQCRKELIDNWLIAYVPGRNSLPGKYMLSKLHDPVPECFAMDIATSQTYDTDELDKYDVEINMEMRHHEDTLDEISRESAEAAYTVLSNLEKAPNVKLSPGMAKAKKSPKISEADKLWRRFARDKEWFAMHKKSGRLSQGEMEMLYDLEKRCTDREMQEAILRAAKYNANTVKYVKSVLGI